MLRQGTGTFVVDLLEDITQEVKCSFNLEFFVAYHS